MKAFSLLKEEKIEEIDSIGKLFRHEKTGAEVVHIKNSDKDKYFSMTFKTLPEDNTGLIHILEHCTLAGPRF